MLIFFFSFFLFLIRRGERESERILLQKALKVVLVCYADRIRPEGRRVSVFQTYLYLVNDVTFLGKLILLISNYHYSNLGNDWNLDAVERILKLSSSTQGLDILHITSTTTMAFELLPSFNIG
jgi:hypothetical protein